jgi:hypothetical protein
MMEELLSLLARRGRACVVEDGRGESNGSHDASVGGDTMGGAAACTGLFQEVRLTEADLEEESAGEAQIIVESHLIKDPLTVSFPLFVSLIKLLPPEGRVAALVNDNAIRVTEIVEFGRAQLHSHDLW